MMTLLDTLGHIGGRKFLLQKSIVRAENFLSFSHLFMTKSSDGIYIEFGFVQHKQPGEERAPSG